MVWLSVIIGLTCFAFFYYAYFPGVFTPDTVDQYTQALTGHYEDGHPPVMAWLWTRLLWFHRGPEVLLAFHLAMFWMALLILVLTARTASARLSGAFFIVGFAPWVANLIGMLWKDIGLAASWLLCVALIVLARRLEKHRLILLTLAALPFFYGLSVRVNAFAGAIPLIYLALRTATRNMTVLRSFAASLAILGAGLLGNRVFDHYIAQAKHTEVTQTYLMFDDLRALSDRARQNLTPKASGVTGELMALCPSTAGVAFCYSQHGWDIGIDKNPHYFEELKQSWIQAIRNDPIGWIEFRLHAFGQLLRWSEPPFGFAVASTIIPTEFGFTYQQTRSSSIIERFVRFTASVAPPLLKPYFWLVLSAALLLLLRFFDGQSKAPAQALLLSSALYLLGYALVTPFYPFRYAYWSALATTVAVIFLLTDRTLHRMGGSIRPWRN